MLTSFAEAIEIVRLQLNDDGKIAKSDDEAVRRVLKNPMLQLPSGERVLALPRIHYRVRRLYARLEKAILPLTFDWTTLVEWIKEHWDEILRFILMVLPFII